MKKIIFNTKRAFSLVIAIVLFSSTFMVNSFAAYENTYRNTGNQRIDIVEVAKTQIGNTNSSRKYRNDNYAWCASFVVWCARQANIDSSVIRTTGYADADDLGVTYRGRPANRSLGINYTPQSGDLIFFDWADGGYCYKSPASSYGDHVGIVESVSGGNVTVIEGNSKNKNETGYKVRRHTYSLSYNEIKGYGVPNYKKVTHTVNTSYPKNFTAYPKAKITASNIFDANHCTISSSSWIGTSDKCTIHEVYTDGCCKVTYPLDAGGTRTVYSKISLFNTSKSYYLDLNSYLNGSYRGDIYGIATADVYINGKLVANDVTDYYTPHPAGTTYRITDIRVKSGYKYNGSSSYSGTLNGNVNVNLSFSKAQTTVYLDLNSYLDGSYRGDISGIATADVYINGKLVANDVTDYYKAHPVGTTYKITDIRVKSGYKYNGSSSYSGTLKGNVNINLSFSKAVTYFTTNFRMKSGAYTNAYSSNTCSSSVGRVYPGDVITVKRIYSNGVAQVVCPWSDSSGSYNRTVYCKVSELKFKATQYIQAYSSVNGSTCGRVYPNDVVTVCAVYSSGWMKAICPWTGGVNKTIYIKCNSIY